MPSQLHNIALIARREYVQRVRTKAFIFTTILTPLILAGFTLAPGYFLSTQFGGQRSIVVASDDPELAKAFEKRITRVSKTAEAKNASAPGYIVTIDAVTSEAERLKLDAELAADRIDAYVWLTESAVNKNTVELHQRGGTDFMELQAVETAATSAAIEQRAAALGVKNIDMQQLLKPIRVQTVHAGRGKTNEEALYIFGVILVLSLYMPVVIQVVAVMRSVIEEKTSRVMEVMLSAVTPKELMAGKIIGVGSVGLTQIAIWAALGAIAGVQGAAVSGILNQVHFSASLMIYFAIFYLLGYLLYSAFAAALGAAVNSDEEAQQLQFFVMLPLIASMTMIGIIFSNPSSGAAVALSLFPFFAPILMFLRIVLAEPPLWQIVLCIGLLAATAYGTLSVCARIYRVGILMYGKRPTLPEILKWIRYA